MSADKIKIGIVFSSDFRGLPQGGGKPTIEIFLKYAQERPFDVWLFGMSTSKTEPIGQVSKRVIYGREYPFIPLFYYDAARHAKQRPFIPVRVQAFLAYLLRRRLVDAHGFDILYLHAPQALPFFWFKRQPILYHMHNPQETEAAYSRYAIARTRAFGYLYRKVIRSILERADEFIVIDQESYDLYTRTRPEKKDRFHLVPTSIDFEQFRPIPEFNRQEVRRAFGLPPEGNMVLFVGRLTWKKGVDLVVRAFALAAAQTAGAFLVVAGDGEDRPGLEALARQLHVSERVFFLGHVPHLPSPDLPRLFNCADVSVVASLHESLALVIAEALACGVPVVSTPVGIAPKVIRDGVSGYLVKSREPAAMAEGINQILRRDTPDPSPCIAAAREYGGTTKRICDVIEGICRRKVVKVRSAMETDPS